MAADERIHEEVVRGLAVRGRARVSGTFRAAVFGANDGLVSNLSLVLGVTGGGASTTTVLLTGLAGLLSGALSMGAGEYVLVRSQRELLAASAPDISDAHTVLPALDLNANELALVYRARGVPRRGGPPRADAVLRSNDPARSVTPDPPTATGTRSWEPGWALRCPASPSSPPAPRCPSCRSCSAFRASPPSSPRPCWSGSR